MQLEDIGTKAIVDSLFTIIDRLINLAANGSHGESIVVSADMITKCFANVVLSSKQLEKLRRDWVERWQDYLSTEAAHAKLGMSIRGLGEPFSHPMECMTVGTLNIHSSQIMDRPVRIEGLPCNWQWNRQWWCGWQMMIKRRIDDRIELD